VAVILRRKSERPNRLEPGGDLRHRFNELRLYVDALPRRRAGAHSEFGDPGRVPIYWTTDQSSAATRCKTSPQNARRVRSAACVRPLRMRFLGFLAAPGAHLKRVLSSYFDYYHTARTHLSLDSNAPEPSQVEPPDDGPVRAIPQVGGLHHRYTRRAA
jgi:hypothetical protein